MRTIEGLCSICKNWGPIDYILLDLGEVYYFKGMFS